MVAHLSGTNLSICRKIVLPPWISIVRLWMRPAQLFLRPSWRRSGAWINRMSLRWQSSRSRFSRRHAACRVFGDGASPRFHRGSQVLKFCVIRRQHEESSSHSRNISRNVEPAGFGSGRPNEPDNRRSRRRQQARRRPPQNVHRKPRRSPNSMPGRQRRRTQILPRLEKAADDFATKFPDSELRVLLYKNAMRAYQKADNAEKTEAMGRKVLACDPDDPEALVVVSEVIAERTRDTDIDRDQRFGEATAMAQKALKTIDTDIGVPAGTPQDKLDAYKSGLRSQAYSIIGAIDYKKENYAAAQEDLQKAIDAYPSDPAPVDVLRLALALDKQQKYPEALKLADRAVQMTQDNTPIGTPARRERERLQQLTGAAAPAQPQTPPKN